MPFMSDAASAIKSRFGFQDRSSEPVQSPSAVLKSATKDILVLSSAIRSTRNSDENDGGACSNTVSSANSFEFHEDPSFWKDNNVQVIIRIRPLSSTEISLQGHGRCVRPENTQTISWMGHPESRFTFDVVADENVSQESLFKVAGLPMVENCVAGYNSCMFAYGQTGSGKTYTMLGDIEGGTRRHSVNCGMTPRVFEHMFSRIQKEREANRDEKLKFVCKCSFLEIYNEQILDLLDPSSNNLQIREDMRKGVYVENLKEIEVTSARDVMQQLIQGAANRKVAATNMNRASSRSHSVFTCIIESEWESQGLTHKRFARLNLVDLAGSERQKSSGAEGERLKEATNINKSLSTLGLVIMNLVNISNGKSVHVPYRDSKLTFLLQDSLGGNAKTIIIANISPSSCCSLETLSTLKFAQRAKFIKNNAIINEDTSGDVITMKMQIQQLKKEVSRLQGLVSGGPESRNNEMMWAVSCPGSPGSLKLEGLDGAISPLASAKRVSHKRDYEVALVGAFRREKDKDITLQALTVENKAAVKLAKQREDEIQGLKMRLRFREAAIKRLEAVASGKISAEIHLLKETEEHLKEIEVLRAQVDRNQEVTRFAMENLRLKEEIRRLKSFYEEGEREQMNEQIMVLEGKLLEALDWKFMHESDPSNIQKTNTDIMVEEIHGDDNLLICNKEPGLLWHPSVNEENELLRMQAIHNQAEMDELRKKLELCLEEKEKLERQDSDLMRKLDEERYAKGTKEGKQQVEIPSHSTDLPTNYNDQTELKTMVDVIAAASQREAEAHETAIILSKENDELRMKLKVLINDNNKLIELYERAILESNYKNSGEALKFCDDTVIPNNGCLDKLNKEEVETSKAVDNLEHQLAEMHEENEKLMGLYERAMTERDELKRMLSAGHKGYERLGDSDCIELVEVDGRQNMTNSSLSMDLQDGEINNDSGKPVPCRELIDSVEYSCFPAYNNMQNVLSIKFDNGVTCNEDTRLIMNGRASVSLVDLQSHSGDIDGTLLNIETVPSNLLAVKLSEVMNQVRTKLERADEQLSGSAEALSLFCMLEKKIIELDKLSSEIEPVKDGIQSKQEHYDLLKTCFSEVEEKKALTNKRLLALKYSLSNFSSSVAYFQERETRAKARLNASTSYVSQKKEELARFLEEKIKIEAARIRIQQSESELTNHLSHLKLKLEEENQKQEDEKVLFSIDNIEKATSQKNWRVGGRATELLKSEEEKTKLQAEIKLSQERIGVLRMELKDLNGNILRLDSNMQSIEVEIQKGQSSVGEMELAFQAIIQEKNTLLELMENGNAEIGSMIVEYLHLVFEADLKNVEMKVLEEELLLELRRVKELGDAKATADEEVMQLLNTSCCYPRFISEKLEDEIQMVRTYIIEAKSLLREGK